MKKKSATLNTMELDNSIKDVQNCRTLTMAEVTKMLGISLPTLYKLIKETDIPVFRVGRRWRVREDKLLAWMDKKSGGQ